MFSKDLELSIASLFDRAHDSNIQYITVEHLLLMILSDFEVKEFFKSKNIQTVSTFFTKASESLLNFIQN